MLIVTRHKFRTSLRVKLLLVLLAILLPGLLALTASLQPWWPPEELFADFLTVAEKSEDCCHVYYGVISYLGIILFLSASAIGMFSALIFRLQKRSWSLFLFALTSGVLSGWLGLDDLFMLHETVFPKLGVTENSVIAAYMVLTLLYVLFSWRIILSSEFWLLLCAGFAFAASIFIDVVVHEQIDAYGPYETLEDSFKFVGISCWTWFHAVALALAIAQRSKPQTVST